VLFWPADFCGGLPNFESFFLHIGFPFCKACAKNTFWSDLLLTCVQFVDVRIGYFFTRFISKQHLFQCLPKNITRNGFLMLISSATEARVKKTCLTGVSLKSIALSLFLSLIAVSLKVIRETGLSESCFHSRKNICTCMFLQNSPSPLLFI